MTANSQPQRPNILILMPDQLRADTLGCAGHPVFHTPHIDRLAREGVQFTCAYANSPLCMPARASVVSGVYPHNHHIQANAGSLPADDETFAQLLQHAGYHTAYLGKIHFFPDDPGRDLIAHEPYVSARGFEDVHEIPGPAAMTKTDNYLSRHWRDLGLLSVYQEDFKRRSEASRRGEAAAWPSPLPVDEFLDSYVGARAIEWLQAYDHDRPFCLWVGFCGPHAPWDAPGEYATMYDPAQMADPIPPEVPGEWVPDYVRDRMPGRRAAETDWDGARQVARERMANYGGKISLIDDWVGRILAVLDARGLADNTLVVFFSDHGEMGGDHLRYQKSVFYESAARVPLILRWPAGLRVGEGEHTEPGTKGAGQDPARPELVEGRMASQAGSDGGETKRLLTGRRSDALVEQIDLFPTFLEAAGAPPSPRALGQSLLPLARGEVQQVRDAAFSELGREIMIRTDRYKYAVDRHGRGFMLYDLQEDPREQRNLIGHPDGDHVEHSLRERMFTWLVSTQVERR